jgi:hypothetical protein
LVFGLAVGLTALVAGGIVVPLLSVGLAPPAEELERRAAEPEESAPVDRTLSGELGPGDRRLAQDGSYVDVHEFSLPDHAVVTIRMESADFNPYLAVLGPDGARVAHDQSPQSGSSRVEFVTSTGGSYRVLANAFHADGIGSYRLRLTVGDLTKRPVPASPGAARTPEPNPYPRPN